MLLACILTGILMAVYFVSPPVKHTSRQAMPMVAKRTMAGASGSVIELSNYLEQRISQKSAEYAAVSPKLDVFLFY